MDVDGAGDPALARHEAAVGAFLGPRAGGEIVAEPPEHRLAAGPQVGAVGPQALAMLDQPLVGAQPAVGLAADEEQAAGLVGGERQAGIDALPTTPRNPASTSGSGLFLRASRRSCRMPCKLSFCSSFSTGIPMTNRLPTAPWAGG